MLTLHIPDMNCGGCAQSVTRIVKAIDAKAAVDIDVPAKLARVDTAAAPERLLAALADAGFPAERAASAAP